MTAEYPAEWLEGMKATLGAEYPAFEAALSKRHASGLRINPLRMEAAREAIRKYAGEPVPWYAAFGRYALEGEGLRPGSDIAHFAGAYYMQEPSAMAAVAALDPRPGERVLDLCAAPGGKSGQIALAIGSRGALVSNEPETARARMLAGNLERLGVCNAAVVSALPDVLARKWPEAFDAVLCDAPCSGEGMFRRDAEARGQWSLRAAEGCAARQRGILEAAVRLVRPGGRLVYSTCTFNRQENEENVEWLLVAHPELTPGAFSLAGVGDSTNGCLRLWPHLLRGEGHFVALLQKAGVEPKAERVGKKRGTGKGLDKAEAARADAAFASVREAVFADIPESLRHARREMLGDRLLLVPERMPDTEGIYCLRRGLPACRVGRSHVEPEHSLAMALSLGDVKTPLALEPDKAALWLRGEPVDAECASGSGWVWTHMGGLPLGWGKSSGTVKNHLPKGLWKR